MVDIRKLSAAKLQIEHDKRAAAWSAILDATIAAGMGQMRGSDIRDLAKTGSGLLNRVQIARLYVDAADARNETFDEMDARQRYSGTLKPIKIR